MIKMSKPNIFLKSSLRQPIFTIFLIILLGLISFAFMGKAVEYLVVQRETNRLGGYYRAIGSLVGLSGNEMEDLSEGAALIQNSPYIAYEDRRRATSGVMDGIWNADISGSSSNHEQNTGYFNADMWFYGKLITKREILRKYGQETDETIGYTLNFQVDTVLAGRPEDIKDGRAVGFLFMFEGHEEAIPTIESMEVGKRYLIRGWKDITFRVDPSWQNASSTLKIRALDDEGLWYLPLGEGTELDFNDPALVEIKNEIDILNENQRALMIYGTSDMSAMPEMQESARFYFLTEGRWLNHQDDLDKKRLVVIQRDFANLRNLELGDTISVTLRGLQNPYVGYITRSDREKWRSYPTYEETLEIVGIYDDLPGLDSLTHTTMAYVPNSILPADVVYPLDGVYASMYSFVLDSSRNQEAFLNENITALAELGIGINFVDNNGTAFWASVTPLRRSAISGLLVYSLVLVVALTLAVFLYLTQRRRDYAILRALGVSRNRANRQLIFPIVLTGAAGILTGGALAWENTLKKTAATFSSLPTPAGILPSTTLNPIYLGAISTGILLLLLVFTWSGVRILAGLPVLELLGRAALAGRAKKRAKPLQQTGSALQSVPEERLWDETTGLPLPAETPIQQASTIGMLKGRPGSSALVRFGLHHISRAGFKSILTILVALGFVLALGWMKWSIDRNVLEVDRLYDTVVVEAEIVEANLSLSTSAGTGNIAGRTIERIMESGFVQNAYTEAAAKLTELFIPPDQSYSVDGSLLAFDQPEQFFETLSTRDTVQYATGWDESLFTKNWSREAMLQQGGVPAIFPESLLRRFNLKLNDVVYLLEESGQFYPYLIVGSYLEGPRQYSGNAFKEMGESVLLPLSALKVIKSNNLYYTTAKFIIDPAKNRELPVFREEMKKMVSEPSAGRLPLQIVFWDEELRAVVEPMEKNLALLEVLFPVTVAVSVLIGIGLSLLLVLQQARETALLRMLGVRRAWVRAMLCSEQVLLSLLGVILGLGLLVILRQDPEAVLTAPTMTTGGLYLLGALIGSLLGAILVSNKQPLELLQVKE
jgi:ABC-type antimicrobial peptide transport system permease subunit